MVVEITIYRLSKMTGNEVTPNYYDEVVFLRVSGFVQQVLAADLANARPLKTGVSMLSRALLFVLAFISEFALAGENLRGVNLGDDCKTAWASEMSLGSVESIEKIPHRNVFEGVAYDMNAYIVYSCDEEVIASQAIMIKSGNLHSSQLTYARVKEKLTSMYGTPKTNAQEGYLELADEEGIDRNLVLLGLGYSWKISDMFKVSINLQAIDPENFYVVISQ